MRDDAETELSALRARVAELSWDSLELDWLKERVRLVREKIESILLELKASGFSTADGVDPSETDLADYARGALAIIDQATTHYARLRSLNWDAIVNAVLYVSQYHVSQPSRQHAKELAMEIREVLAEYDSLETDAEAGAEVVRLRAALGRVRQGYLNILDCRRFEFGDEFRYGALHRQEVEAEIKMIDAALGGLITPTNAVDAESR